MKRTHGSMESPQARAPSSAPSRRQEPVSCQFCRAKKLKCSRESPCSNCIARNIECVGVHVTSRATTAPAPVPNAAALPPHTLSLQSLDSRLHKVETALSLRPFRDSGSPPIGNTNVEPSQNLSSHTTPQAHEANDGAEKRHSRLDIECVEMTTRMGQSESRFARGFDTSQLLQMSVGQPQGRRTSSQWYEVLPAYEQAVQLMDFYAHNVCWQYHFLHIPTLRRQLHQVYVQLSQNEVPEPSVLALMCSVFAVAIYFSKPPMHPAINENFLPSVAQNYCDFATLASQALGEAQHLDHPTVESIQSVMLLTSCLLTNLGHMTAFRSLITTMFLSAQAIGIHQIDSPKSQRARQNTDYDRLDLEIKRRLWWHIVSSDWIFAFLFNSQIEFHLPHTPRIHVNLPSNTDDATITPSHSPNEPLTIPTEMTYFLFRCRLAVIFREFMEEAVAQDLDLDEVSYDSILVFDHKIDTFVASVPYFLDMSPENRRRCVELDKQRPYLSWQRVMSQFGPTTRMSGVHRAYMACGAKDPRYAYSRMICLRSARTVLELEKVLRLEMPPSLAMPDPSKISALIYSVFIATMVLVMDYHFNKSEPNANERLEEIMDCCRRLENAKEVSSVAARGLDGLQAVMRRWGLLKEVGGRPADGGMNANVDSTVPPSATATYMAGAEQQDPQMAGADFSASSWMNAWDFDVELNGPQWSALFQDLESHSGMF